MQTNRETNRRAQGNKKIENQLKQAIHKSTCMTCTTRVAGKAYTLPSYV
ncbi:hypothetical protein [Chlorogloeopsis sp. ULAP02]